MATPGAEGHWDGELVFNGPEFQFYKMDDEGGWNEIQVAQAPELYTQK